MKNIWKWKDCIWMEIWRCSVAFKIIEKNGKSYRKNINTTGQCVHYPEIRCVCCNPECDHNCSIDDELEEELENRLDEFIYS